MRLGSRGLGRSVCQPRGGCRKMDKVQVLYLPNSKIKEDAMTGYCMKCRESREIENAEEVTMKNGRPANRGTCGTCGTTMFKIGKAS